MMGNQRKAVITGIGIVSPAGIGYERHWSNVRAGMNCIRDLRQGEGEHWPFRYGGRVENCELPSNYSVKLARNLNRANRLAIVAAGLALEDAGIAGGFNPETSGVFF
jgi:3-oxoacyl-(acyl-carrier-protein) synthase